MITAVTTAPRWNAELSRRYRRHDPSFTAAPPLSWLRETVPNGNLGLMFRTFRQFLLVLIAFAFLGGTTQLAWSDQHATPTMVGMPCDMMMSMAGDGPAKPTMPCKTMTPDCLKHMSSGTVAGLPSRFAGSAIAVQMSRVDYWNPWSKLIGVISAPEPLPPRTI
jgi:hypothetical protein